MEDSLVVYPNEQLTQINQQAFNLFLPSAIARNIELDFFEFRECLKEKDDPKYKAFWHGIAMREAKINEEFLGATMALDAQRAEIKWRAFRHHKGQITKELYK